MSSSNLLELNKAALIFFPSPNTNTGVDSLFPTPSNPGLVVQVMIQTSKHAYVRPLLDRLDIISLRLWYYTFRNPVINEIASFFLAQHDITVRDLRLSLIRCRHKQTH